jgi:formylglycine-generating enzyme required for sulfatase activity
MAGNVDEWCYDWYGANYYAQSQESKNPSGPKQGESRIIRGGNWNDEHMFYCRCGSIHNKLRKGEICQIEKKE